MPERPAALVATDLDLPASGPTLLRRGHLPLRSRLVEDFDIALCHPLDVGVARGWSRQLNLQRVGNAPSAVTISAGGRSSLNRDPASEPVTGVEPATSS